VQHSELGKNKSVINQLFTICTKLAQVLQYTFIRAMTPINIAITGDNHDAR
jgi:hypothetical protein